MACEGSRQDYGVKQADETIVSKPEAVSMAKQGQIAGVGIAHRGDTEYLKAIPNGSQNDNLGNLPSVSPETQTSYLGRQHHSEVDGLFVYSNSKFEKVLPQLGRSYDVHYESRSLRWDGPCKMVVLNGVIF